ncbi:MAG: 30S ribosomal protein S9, partial [bacterium]|nr:30S ribosomal protein S9 [bacterium]
MPKTKTPVKNKYIASVGRRRESVARVRLYLGKGESLVNDKPIAEYFPGEALKVVYMTPFEETGTAGKYYITVKVAGGGKVGQLGAVVHGIARALSEANREKFRTPLKKKGLLTRDSRTRERRKVGKGG